MLFVIKQEHVTVPIGSLWWRFRYPLGVIFIDKSLLTTEGKKLHKKVINCVWWFVRFTLLGLLLGIAYASFIN